MFKSFIIGCGRIAGYSNVDSINNFTHGFAYNKNSIIQLAGCMDINTEKGKLFAGKFNSIFYNDFQDGIVITGSEIVSVCTPDETHYMIVKSLLEMESNIRVIFLEKPACKSKNELDELISISREKNIDIVINHSRRFDNRYHQIKNQIADDNYGILVNGIITYYSGWQHNGVHIIDTLSFLFNDSVEIESVKIGENSPYPDDPTINGKLFFSKLPGKLQLMSFDESYYQLFEFDLRFEKARLRIEDFGSRISLEKKVVNDIGENVLVVQDSGLVDNVKTPIETAVDLIVYRLVKSNPDLLNGYRLQDVANTMNTIWKGLKLYGA